MTGFAQALQRLRLAIHFDSPERRGLHETMIVKVADLVELIQDWMTMDARLRSDHVRKNPEAYPPRHDMLVRAASDPGLFAGWRGERSMGQWIADAILAIERREARQPLLERARAIADQVNWGDTRTDALAKRYYDTAVDRIAVALEQPHPAQTALRALIDMVDRMDRRPSNGGGVLPVDKATIMHDAREAAR